MSEPAKPDDKSPGKPNEEKPPAGKSGKTVFDMSWSEISLTEILKEHEDPQGESPAPAPDKKSFADFALDEIMAQQAATVPVPATPTSIAEGEWTDVPVKPPVAATKAPPAAEKRITPPQTPKAAESAPEKIKEVAVNPEAMLFPRKKDIQVAQDKLVVFRDSIGLFAQLKSKPSVEKWPGTLGVAALSSR